MMAGKSKHTTSDIQVPAVNSPTTIGLIVWPVKNPEMMSFVRGNLLTDNKAGHGATA
jgi:hypothetical protein